MTSAAAGPDRAAGGLAVGDDLQEQPGQTILPAITEGQPQITRGLWSRHPRTIVLQHHHRFTYCAILEADYPSHNHTLRKGSTPHPHQEGDRPKSTGEYGNSSLADY